MYLYIFIRNQVQPNTITKHTQNYKLQNKNTVHKQGKTKLHSKSGILFMAHSIY